MPFYDIPQIFINLECEVLVENKSQDGRIVVYTQSQGSLP